MSEVKKQPRRVDPLVIALALLFVVFGFAVVAAHVIPWAMQVSGWNCFLREVGYAQGFGEPPEQSSYCSPPPSPITNAEEKR